MQMGLSSRHTRIPAFRNPLPHFNILPKLHLYAILFQMCIECYCPVFVSDKKIVVLIVVVQRTDVRCIFSQFQHYAPSRCRHIITYRHSKVVRQLNYMASIRVTITLNDPI